MKSIFSSLLLLLGCAGANTKTYSDGYPDIWWKEIPKDQLASWEIAPQAADRSKKEVILSKRTELGKFSNFEASSFELDGKKYASVEGFWQSLKYPENEKDERAKDNTLTWPHTRAEVEQLTAFEAKHAGDVASENMKKLNINWVTYQGKKINYDGKDPQAHYDLIERATRAKLKSSPQLQELLLKTGDLKLLPDHAQKQGSPPSYAYFDIYMKLRQELLKTQQK